MIWRGKKKMSGSLLMSTWEQYKKWHFLRLVQATVLYGRNIPPHTRSTRNQYRLRTKSIRFLSDSLTPNNPSPCSCPFWAPHPFKKCVCLGAPRAHYVTCGGDFTVCPWPSTRSHCPISNAAVHKLFFARSALG